MGKYTIYLRRNKVNGKQYVGQTVNLKQREYEWKCLNKKYANKYISNDRVKYGLDNFTVETLAEADNREDAWELEQRFIKDLDTLWPNGYNLESGGFIGKKHSEETKEKISEALKGEKNAMYGKHHTDETKEKMSESHKGKPSPRKGKRLSDETRKKICEVSKKRCKMVYQYSLDGELIAMYNGRNEAGRNTKFNSRSIGKCCTGYLETYKGYRWSYVPL